VVGAKQIGVTIPQSVLYRADRVDLVSRQRVPTTVSSSQTLLKEEGMKHHITCAAYALGFLLAVRCQATDSSTIPPSCDMVQSSAVTDLTRRIEIAAPGFSVLPPRGKGWCYRLMTSHGISFFKLPESENAFDGPLSLRTAALHLSGAMALSLKGLRDFGTNIQTPDELKTLVNVMIREHLFSQISAGVISAEHRFRLLTSSVAIDSSLGASCVRFDTTVEERGGVQAPTLVLY
jgi:hypothetical protein